MRRTLTDRGVAGLKVHAERYAYPDPQLPGLFVRVQPSGLRSYYIAARDPAGKQHWVKVGDAHIMPIAEARERARAIVGRVRVGLSAFEPPPVAPDSFKDVAEQWIKRHAQAKGLRSLKQITRLLRVHVYPNSPVMKSISDQS